MKGNDSPCSKIKISLHEMKRNWDVRYSNTKINSIYMKWNNKMASHESQWQIARGGIKEIKWQGWLSGHREHLPSTNVARVQFPYSASNVDWVCWFSAMRGFSPGTPVFPSHQNLIWFVENNIIVNSDLSYVDLISSRIVNCHWKTPCGELSINSIVVLRLNYIVHD